MTGRGEGRTRTEAHKFDPSLPENARKLEALSKLGADAGISLPHLAVGFDLNTADSYYTPPALTDASLRRR